MSCNAAAGHSVTTEISGWQWTPITTASVTNVQLGTRLQWLGSSSNLIVFNTVCPQPQSDRLPNAAEAHPAPSHHPSTQSPPIGPEAHSTNGKVPSSGSADSKQGKAAAEMQTAARQSVCAAVYDLQQGATVQALTRPVYSVSPDGSTATSFSFERMDIAAGMCIHSCM